MSRKPLYELHHRLTSLRRRRKAYRWATGFSASAIAVLWALALTFVIDYFFQQTMDLGQRLLLMGICAFGVLWAFVRYTKPLLGGHESELDLALMVQRQESIDTDLVAALEFEWPEAKSWGSVDLEQAVISSVANRERRLDVMKNLPRRALSIRLKILGATVLLWAAVILLAPQIFGVFLHRLLMSTEHYPTRTRIEMIVVDGQEIPLADWGKSPVRLHYGQPIRLEVRGAGSLPESGRASLAAIHSDARTELEMPAVSDPSGVFAGQMPRLVEPVRCQFYLGDAWTGAAELTATPLPIVEVTAEVIPPPYAKPKEGDKVAIRPGARQFAVIEGSCVRMKIHSDRPLTEAVIALDDKPYRMELAESSGTASQSAGPQTWELRAKDSPLEYLEHLVRYSVRATDSEGQNLEKPIEGLIRIEADLPPRVTADTRTPLVLSKAKPTVRLSAVDDHAIARVWFAYEILPAGAKPKEGEPAADISADIRKGEVPIYDLPADGTPDRKFEAIRELDMSPLKVVPGDTVKVTVWAKDYRGSRDGKATSSEPLMFEVTDEQGIWASMLEGYKTSSHDLKTMIQQQLGIGNSQER